MFWGLIMEPNKRYTQTVEKSFHVSMATLDVSTADEEVVQVMVCYESRNYLLCNLKKGLQWQAGLDLHFEQGTKISFTSNGRGHVHLTGYVLPDESDMPEMDEEVSDEEESESDTLVPELSGKSDKRKASKSPASSEAKRLKMMEELLSNQFDEDDDDGEEEEEDDEDEEDDDDEEEEDEAEEEEESEDESDEKEVVTPPQPQTKKNKQEQKNQKAQKQQQTLVNGKDAKSKQKNKEEQIKKEAQSPNEQQAQKKKFSSGGVQIEELKVGSGAPAKHGKFVSVYYVGKFKNGKKFDATTNGDGFKFRLGKSEVIKGWDIGVQGMKVGGKRRLTVPPNLAYGAKGSPPDIPPNSTLVFDVELKKVH